MIKRTLTEAKGQLSALVEAALNGEDVVLSRSGKLVIRMVPIESKTLTREPGGLEGLVIPDDFDKTDPDIIEIFHGGSLP